MQVKLQVPIKGCMFPRKDLVTKLNRIIFFRLLDITFSRVKAYIVFFFHNRDKLQCFLFYGNPKLLWRRGKDFLLLQVYCKLQATVHQNPKLFTGTKWKNNTMACTWGWVCAHNVWCVCVYETNIVWLMQKIMGHIRQLLTRVRLHPTLLLT